jgi:chromosome segregation ATPase
MKRPVYKAVILAVGVVILLIAGCGGQEQDVSKSETIKRERLIAAENRQLRKQSEQLKKEKELLAKRLQEEKASEEHLRKSGEERMQNLLKAATEENSKLRQTIEGLKVQARQLEEELKKIKGSKKSELKAATEENSKLSQTIKELKVRAKQLEGELEKLRDSEKFKKWQEETQKSIEELSEKAFKDFKEIAKLQEENENLKTEIMELKKELETYKGTTPLQQTE